MNVKKMQVLQAGMQAAPQDTIKYWYVYSIANFATSNIVANTATGTGSVQIQSDSDFLLQHLTAVGKSAAGAIIADAAMDCTVQITDASSGATLFDQPQQLRAVFGDAKLPYVLPTPRVLPANSTLQATIVNNTGGNLILALSLLGRKIYGLR